jgi:polyisoprenoid-binding protein YceI
MSLTATIASLPGTGVWKIDSLHSSVQFSVRHHAVATFRSSFVNVSGAYDAGARRLSGEVAVADIALTGLDRLKAHILTPDFFDAEAFPTFGFTTTEIRERDGLLEAVGELTLRGVTREITATGAARGPQTTRHGDGHISERLGIDLRTVIDRRDWGINFNNEVAEGIINLGWDVTIEAALELFAESEQ